MATLLFPALRASAETNSLYQKLAIALSVTLSYEQAKSLIKGSPTLAVADIIAEQYVMAGRFKDSYPSLSGQTLVLLALAQNQQILGYPDLMDQLVASRHSLVLDSLWQTASNGKETYKGACEEVAGIIEREYRDSGPEVQILTPLEKHAQRLAGEIPTGP